MTADIILGIESSCDETSVAVLVGRSLLGQATAHQTIHTSYGGVVPELAARAHQSSIVRAMEDALVMADVGMRDVDVVAVTQGPGLLGSLLVGVSFAQGLAIGQRIPLIGIHHTRAHLLANFIERPYPSFPFLGVIVSGGHTQLVHARGPLDIELLGGTRDDAIGEAFDKVGRMFGLPYPAGVHIDRLGSKGNPMAFSFGKSGVGGFDFSFSGVKTAVLYALEKATKCAPDFVSKHLNDLCASIQYTLVRMLLDKVVYALDQRELSRVVLGGGVASNSVLRAELEALGSARGCEVFVPRRAYCTDNGAMIAVAGFFHLAGGCYGGDVIPDPRMPF